MNWDSFLGGFFVGLICLVVFGNVWDRALGYLAKHDRCPYCKDHEKSCIREAGSID